MIVITTILSTLSFVGCGYYKVFITNNDLRDSSEDVATREIVDKDSELYFLTKVNVDAKQVEKPTSKAATASANYIEFGSYPQTEVKDSALVSALKTQAGTLPTASNSQRWTNYGYYLSGSSAAYMWYIDLSYNGGKYRGVYFTSYRPYNTAADSNVNSSFQDDNGYDTEKTYWFKFEPIKWRVLSQSGSEALILCESIIDSQEYYSEDKSASFSHNGGTGYANNYALSNIRKWLNNAFYNAAFSDTEKKSVLATTVNNNARNSSDSGNALTQATTYYCSNTSDNVFLLSEQEVTTATYGFAADYTVEDDLRCKIITDYAKSQGAWPSINYGFWWLRSPSYDKSRSARNVFFSGSVNSHADVYATDYGVVPAMRIKLS